MRPKLASDGGRGRVFITALPICAALLSSPADAAAPAAARTCDQAAQDAERAWSLPVGLLQAIGRAESGRPDASPGHASPGHASPGHASSGRATPWPWTTNANGGGRYFESDSAAVAYVRQQQEQGVRSIDVGCFQVNLLHHPEAFATLQQAFDPDANANAAAAFLTALHHRSLVWDVAVAQYHSALPERGLPYSEHVLASWRGAAPGVALATARDAHNLADPVVVLVSARAQWVHVMVPQGTQLAPFRAALLAHLPQIRIPTR